MAVSEAGRTNRLKTAVPVAAVALLAAALTGGVLMMTQGAPAPTAGGLLAASDPQPQPPKPGGLAGVQVDQVTPQGVAPTGAQLGMEIVVKFKDDGKVKDIVDSFWRDQAAARAKFESFKARRPELANLKLDRVTYSNELVLVHEGGPSPDRRVAAMREIASKLKGVADISYAEPNMTAHPGGQ
jgi:hypothetical protein